MMLANLKDYSVITLDTKGRLTGWNGAAERITGHAAADAADRYVSIFYTPEEAAIGKPTTEIETAIQSGRFGDDGWRVRRDGSRSADLKDILTTSNEDQDRLCGYRLGANSFRKPVEFDPFIEPVLRLGLYWLILIEAAPAARRF